MNFKNINKISLIGGPSTGKSTLAENMGRKLNLPIIHMDGINYDPGWVQVDKEKRDNIIRKHISEPKWLMEGTYTSTLKERLEKSDLVIFLDYSTATKLKGIFQRTIEYRGKERKDIPGCKEKMEWDFVKFTLQWNKKKRGKIVQTLNELEKEKVIIFKNRRQLNKWYKEEFGESVRTDYLKNNIKM